MEYGTVEFYKEMLQVQKDKAGEDKLIYFFTGAMKATLRREEEDTLTFARNLMQAYEEVSK